MRRVECATATDGEVGTLSCRSALGGHAEKKNRAPLLVAGVRKRVMLKRPALKALPNLSLNVSDTLRATRAK